MRTASPPRVAVVGTGLAGATCAQALARAGCAVQAFEKSRGVGGRLATRTLSWVDAQGQPRQARLDHGAPGFAVTDEGFRGWLAQVLPPGAVQPWAPAQAAGGRAFDPPAPWALTLPDGPVPCRVLLAGLPVELSVTVDALERHVEGWRIGAQGRLLPGAFDAVVVAVPPAQAAPLLAPHRPDWAAHAAAVPMHPCWTLMGVTRRPAAEPAWAVARPSDGPLAWALRHDRRPGREAPPGEAHWVLHATPGWSRHQLEAEPDAVRAALQAALEALGPDATGEPLRWAHAVVHRWRYAVPAQAPAGEPCAWDAGLGLGLCGDALGGVGAEGAWRSARALAQAMGA